jgi:tetratricopeptide (TPR) repeat protein
MTSTDATVGMQLTRMGRFADALPYLERANRIAPADAQLLQTIADLLVRAGRGGDAVQRYLVAASLAPKDIHVLCGYARVLLLTGDRSQALAAFERALALEPDRAGLGGWIDQILWETVDLDTACNMLRELVDRRPSHAGLLGVCGKRLRAVGRLQEAQTAYERYRELRPQDTLPRVRLGALAVSHGDSAAAIEHYRSALEVDPDCAAALWGLAQIGDGRLEPGMLASVERLIETGHDPRDLVRLHDIMARHHDRNGDFTKASQHCARTNTLMMQIVPPQRRYDPRQHESAIDHAIRNNTQQLFDRLGDAGSRERRPVFVIGLPRSGTTLLEQVLASHPAVVGVGEQTIAAASLQRALAMAGGSLETLTAQAVDDAAAWHLQMLETRVQRMAIQSHADRIVDKMPDNYLLAGWLHLAFPNAAIIHCLRDPRDVALSCWMTQFNDMQWSNDLEHIAHRIEQHRRLVRHWRATIGDHLTELRYEHLVADPEKELRRALAAIGVDWHPDVLAFADRKGFVASASRQQVREPIHARGVARWRNYEHVLQPILPRLNAVAAQDMSEAEAAPAD